MRAPCDALRIRFDFNAQGLSTSTWQNITPGMLLKQRKAAEKLLKQRPAARRVGNKDALKTHTRRLGLSESISTKTGPECSTQLRQQYIGDEALFADRMNTKMSQHRLVQRAQHTLTTALVEATAAHTLSHALPHHVPCRHWSSKKTCHKCCRPAAPPPARCCRSVGSSCPVQGAVAGHPDSNLHHPGLLQLGTAVSTVL